MASYRSTSTYVDAVPPPGAKFASYKVKRPPGAPLVFKACYVARAQRDYELHSLDFSTVFIQGSLHEQIWLRRLPCFTGSFPPGTQCQLRRLVYVLRQAPRDEWHDTLCTTLAALDFFPSSADPSLFVRHGSTPFFVLVYRRHICTDLGELQRYLGLQITRDRAARTITLTQPHMVEQILTQFRSPFSKVQPTPLAVDHGLRAPPSDEPFNSTAILKELKELLEAAFELREISPVERYLGLEIVRDRLARKLWLHQQGYADKLRRRFIDEEQNERTPKTPVLVDAYAELTFDDEEAQENQEEEYRQKVGSLHFAATTRRADIAFACSKLGSGLTVRSDQHWREVDRCLAYLSNTRDTALEFDGGPQLLKLVGYVDADDAGDKPKRTSTGGYVLVFGGAAVSWSSQSIKCAMLSSTESEYVAATVAGKEGRRLRFLLPEIQQLDAGTPTVLRVENKPAITVAEGMGLTGNLKHMEHR
ncbi:unnamed protein product [Closterium sp. NIES-53]